MHRVSIELRGHTHRLEPDLHESSQPTPDRHRPDISTTGLPVGGNDWRDVNVPALFHVVVDEVLQQELVYTWTRSSTGDRPDVVSEDSERPVRGLN